MPGAPKRLIQAIELENFDYDRSIIDVPNLVRPDARPENLPGDGRVAAVLMLFFPEVTNAEVPSFNLVLTKRNANLSKHASQISFPGGRRDQGESLRETALRETEEEVGVPRSKVEILGQLNPVYIPPSDFTVTPFIGWCSKRPVFQRSEEEVDEIIETSVGHLLKPTTVVWEEVESQSEGRIKVPLYRVGEHQVWGATAIMLTELVERLRKVIEK